MKTFFIAALMMLSANQLNARKFEWLYSNRADYNGGIGDHKVKSDALGNIFIMGRYSGNMIHGTDTLLSYGSASCFFLTKLDPSGNRLWTKTFWPYNSSIEDMCIDSNGFIYASLFCNSNVTYADGDTSFIFPDLYAIVSFDNDGNARWGKAHPYPAIWMPMTASLQHSGFYTAGYTGVSKMDSDGNAVWTQTVSPAGFYFTGIECNDDNTLAACGWTGFPIVGNFSLDTVSFTIANYVSDLAIFRMDTSGSAIWSHVAPNLIGGQSYYSHAELLVNSASEIYHLYRKDYGILNYVFAGDTIFNPITPQANCGAVLKWDSNGNPLWAGGAVYADGSLYDFTDFVFDDNEDVIIGGTTGAGNNYFGSNIFSEGGSGYSLFAAKVLADGTPTWFKSDNRLIGGLVYDITFGICKGINNTINLMGVRTVGFASTFNVGCLVDSTIGSGYITLNISENQEPVPVIQFDVVQSAAKIVAKNNTLNATSIVWNFGDGTPASSLAQPYHVYTNPGVYNLCLTAYNNCGMGTECRQIVVKGIREIRKNRGSNDGVITTEIYGGGFTPATTARLLKQSGGVVVPIALQFIDAGKMIARFNLSGEQITLCDLEVDVPGDTLMVLTNAFNIVAATPYKIEITTTGQKAGRPNNWLKQTITVKNSSDKDAVGVPVFFRYRDENVNQFVYGSFENITSIPFTNTGYQYLQNNGLNTALADYLILSPQTISGFGGYVIPLLKAGETYTKTVFLKSTTGQQFGFGQYAFNPIVSNAALVGNISPESDLCLGEFFKRAIESSFSVSISNNDWNNCFPALYDSILYSVTSKAISLQSGNAISWNAFLTAALTSIIDNGCIAGLPALLTNVQIESVLNHTISNMAFFHDIDNGFNCPQVNQLRIGTGIEPPVVYENELCDLVAEVAGTGINVFAFPFSSVGGAGAYCLLFSNSIDPNAKYGPGDNNTNIYTKPGALMPYTIAFENLAIAPAPASEVFITDTLDKTKLDIGTFEFGPIYIGDSIEIKFAEPGFEQIAFTNIPGTSNQIRTLAIADTASGVLQWIFTTVYASDKQPNPNPFEGFLPPNVIGNEGAGSCSYIISARQSLVTGDQIDNDAEIIFDNNAPIVTNTWTNIVDITLPQSAVNALAPNINTTQFPISWGGSDFISGIRGYKIFVSENDAPYQLLIPYTDSTSFLFNGVNGNKYEFFSIAADRAGNIELPPTNPDVNPDAVTTVLVGLNEYDEDFGISLFPNPASNSLTIKSDKFEYDEIKIVDVLGKIMMHNVITTFTEIQIDITNYPSGVYSVELGSSNKKVHAKFIKEH